MNNQSSQTSATEPRLDFSESSDQRFKISYHLCKYEGFLFQTTPPSTYERYSRALSKFISYLPEKRFTYEFLRPHFEDDKKARLKEGASATTINIELSIVRGFGNGF